MRKYAVLSIVASILTLFLKFGAFFLTNSVGLFSDAVESVVNLSAGIMALLIIIAARRPADRDHAYGHGKLEYFSSGMEGFLVCVAAVSIGWASLLRFMSPQELVSLGAGIIVAALAGLVNLITARIMLRAAKSYDSIVLEADARHLLTDVWTSAGLVAALAILLIAPHWRILDPLIGLLMSAHIARTGVRLMNRSFQGLLDVGLPEEEIRAITDVIHANSGEDVCFHALRTRKAGSVRFVEFHLLVPGNMTVHASHDLCCALEKALQGLWKDAQISIHVEPREDFSSFDDQLEDEMNGRTDVKNPSPGLTPGRSLPNNNT